MSTNFGIKQTVGALLFDAPRYLVAFAKSTFSNRNDWLTIHNRNEVVAQSKSSIGVKCLWQWTSTLHLPKIFPWFGRELYRRSLNAFPIALSTTLTKSDKPADISFIIGHRGLERLPLLLTTLESIAGQIGCTIECIVVEQDYQPLIQPHLPKWVNYVFTGTGDKDIAYSRSAAFNVGLQHAKSDLIIFHDNDLLVPACYAKEHLEKFSQGFDFVNLKRFLFYFDRASSSAEEGKSVLDSTPVIEEIMQNAEGGGSIGASKAAYLEVGGFDDRFVGWGSEDNEFWERALTRKVWEYGLLPLIHLWHAPQAGKIDNQNSAAQTLYKQLSLVSPEQRIKDLLAHKSL